MGFQLPAGLRKPEEGHLVICGDDVVGNVTSCEYSPALDAIIGMAYVAVADSTPDSRVGIRVEGGQVHQARVVSMPFYDPENQRQEM